jgi:RTX calcium-binding nonapeptide repeat (4 copies)
MRRKAAMLAVCAIACLAGAVIGGASGVQGQVASTPPFDDGAGREWRQLTETTGLSWAQVATVCPQDGVTPCSGAVGGRDLTGWTWATGDQLLTLLQVFDPTISWENPVGGLWAGIYFLDVFRPTAWFANTYSAWESASGWSASKDAAGLPISAGADFSHPPISGALGIGSGPDGASAAHGVFLFRQAGVDYTPPIIHASVNGQLGRDGWYVSDVSVSWDIVDPESAITATSGCETTIVTEDTAGVTFTCTATSQAASASASVTVKRDTTPPGLVCSAVPVFSLGQPGALVTASVSDSLSGALSATAEADADVSAGGSFSAQVTGYDRAGNASSVSCGYRVTVPTCRGYTPTILGTAGHDTITGTANRDVILALGGNDRITALGGDDIICGGDGADYIDGGAGNDLIDAGDGGDTVYGMAGKDTILGGAGDDALDGGDGDDTLDGEAGMDALYGQGGKDKCRSGEVRASSCDPY